MEKTNVSTRLYWSSSGQCTTQTCTGLYTHTLATIRSRKNVAIVCLQGDYRQLVCWWWVLLSWLVMAATQHLLTSMPWSRLKFLSLAVVQMCRASFTSNSLCLCALSSITVSFHWMTCSCSHTFFLDLIVANVCVYKPVHVCVVHCPEEDQYNLVETLVFSILPS